MKKSLLIAGALVVAVLGAVAVAEARGPMGAQAGGGRGMMGQGMMMGQGQGMMGQGRGMMMGQGMMDGSCAMMNGGTFDPTAMVTRMESMVAQHEAALATLETQLAEATDETVKANLTARIEWQKLVLGQMQERIEVLKAQAAKQQN